MLLFLSHSGADTEAAQRLKAAILAHPAAKAAGLEVWLDVDELVAGQPWRPQLEDGLARATAFCVYIGGAGIVNWVDNEVDVALDRATGVGAIPFIPALAADTSDYDDLPPFVRRFQGVSDPLGDPQALADLIEGAVGGQVDVAPQAATTRPFVGLQPMREGDADRFFGRSDEVNALIAKVRRHPITAVVADSGAGKSSLVRAGLVPAFRGGRLAPEDDQAARDRTRIALVMRPGDDPLAGLRLAVDTATDRLGLGFADRVALRDGVQIQDPDKAAYALACTHPPDRTDVLLVVDQFEELLTQTAPDAAADFVALMLALAEPSVHRHVRIVLTVRNDYFNLISQYPGLADALAVEDGAAQLRLKALGPEALAEIVQRPLALAGHTNLDDQTALVAAIRNQVSDRPGDVALVQIALEATWDHHRQTGDTLLQSFTAVGGVRGALDTVAERERKDLSAEEQALLPALFVRLVRLGDSAGATRRPALLDDLDAQRRALAQKLAAPEQRRLLMTSETTAEVSHEALFRQWPWLQNHIQRNAEAIRTLGRFAEQAAAWVGSGHKWSALPNTADRQAFDALTKEHPGWPTEPEKKMLARAKTKWALMMTGLGGVMAAVAVSAVLAVIFQQKAAESARIAEERLIAETKAREDADFALQQANEARVLQTKILEELSETQVISVEARIDAERNASGALAALARIEATKAKPDPVVAAKLALASWPKSSPTTLPQIRDVPATLSRTTPRLLSRPWEIKPAYRHVGGQFSATGRHLALTRKGPMRLIDTFADKVLAEIELYPYSKNYAFSPDGHWFAATRQALTAQLWDLKSLRTLRLGAGQSPVTAVAFTHDSKAVAYITREGVFTVQELGSNRRLTRYKVELSAPASQLALSPDGTEFAIVTREGLAFHRTGDGGLLLYERLPTQSLRTLQYTADGERLVFAFETTKTEVQVTDDLGNARTVTNRVSLNWARRGAELQVASPLPLDRKARHQSTLYLDLAPEEAQALAEPATPDNTFNKLAIHLGNQAKIIGAAMGPDDTIVTVNEKSEVYLTDIATMKTQAIWRLRGLPAVDVHMDRDGKIRVARADGRTETLDPATADAHFSAVSLQRLTDLVAISTNGAYGAYISHEDLAFVVISLPEDETLWRIPRQQRTVFRGFAVSNDGSALATEQSEDTIAVHLKDGTVQILDPATIALPGWREGQKSYADVMAFSADGSRLLTGGGHRSASSLVVWDVATGTAIYAMAPTGSRLSAAAFIPGANAVIGYWDTFGAHVLPLDRVPPNVMVLQTGKQGYAELSSGFRPRFIGPARAVTSRGRGLAVIDALTDTTLGFIGTAGVTGGKHISVVGTDPDTGQILTWHRDTRQIGRWRDPVPPGDAFQVICALLPRQDGAVPLDDIVPGYPIAIRDRICDADYDPPLPDWVPQLPGAVR